MASTTMEGQDPWHLTVCFLEGLRLMRPEKAWRPIVTVEVDKHYTHETVLGVDGQCVNQKEVFEFHDATSTSKVEVNIWHRSQSKKKRKRILVGSASHTLGELMKKQETEPKLEIRLQCRTTERSCSSSRGKPQKGAVLRLKLKAPSTVDCARVPVREKEEAVPSRPKWRDSWSSPDDMDDSSSVSTDANPLDDTPLSSQPQPSGLRRRKVRGYVIDSDDEDSICYSDDDSISGLEVDQDPLSIQQFDGDPIAQLDPDLDDEQILHLNTACIDKDADKYSKALVYRSGSGERISLSPGDGEWIAMMADKSLLPQYSEKLTTSPELGRIERILASMTMYGELSSAGCEDEFDPVFRRLQQEWTFIGGLLVALAAVDTAVFSISPGSIFNVDSWAKGAIAFSSISSGLGIACDAWFLLRYNWADLRTFITRSRDVFDSYLFFSISARVPAFCMFISAVSLMLFLGIVAFDAWPEGVLFISVIVGILMSMQFLAFGAHWCATTVAKGGRAGGKHVVLVVRKWTLPAAGSPPTY